MPEPDLLAMVVEFRAAPGRAHDLREALLALVGPTRAEDGCLRYDLHDDRADEDFFAFYEVWASPEAHAAHDRTDHVRALVTVLPELTVQPPRVLRMRPIEPR
ncbi:MAG: putative quinol monooxygenase [Candidatus Nanopelagicales bacterium]